MQMPNELKSEIQIRIKVSDAEYIQSDGLKIIATSALKTLQNFLFWNYTHAKALFKQIDGQGG